MPGKGERKLRKHRADKRRVWREVHLNIAVDSREVREVGVSDRRHGDREIVSGPPAQLPRGKRLEVLSGDRARDIRGSYKASASPVVPPAVTASHGGSEQPGPLSATMPYAAFPASAGGSGSVGAAICFESSPRLRRRVSTG